MHFDHLSELEDQFRVFDNNGEYNLKKISIPVPGENLLLQGLLCVPTKRSGYYFATEYPKERIVVHFTAGQIRSDMQALTKNDYHVSVPFVIARDGIIYQLYSYKFWSGNIGRGLGNDGTRNAQDKCTVAIELSNYGYLNQVNGNLETFYSRQKDNAGNAGPVDVYCSLNEKSAYNKVDIPYRNQSYYASFTEEQYNSLLVLLRYLTKKYNIPRQFLPEPQRYQTISDVLDFKGIVSYVNYRVSGKWDIGPAFNWNKIISSVQSAEYIPIVKRSIQAVEPTAQKMIKDEQEIVQYLPTPKNAAFENNSYDEELKHSVYTKPKLFALLIGINQYPGSLEIENKSIIFPELRGCVNDSNKVGSLLNKQLAFDVDIKMLHDKEASKNAIIEAFENHLSKANESDTVVFYFSGHGSKEYIDIKLFDEETDGESENIVSYFDINSANNFLISDKELRWLIHRVSNKNPHILTIFDCCHSGDNTRAIKLSKSFDTVVPKKVVKKDGDFVFPIRNWSDYIFAKEFSEQDLKNGMNKLLPEGKHFRFSACESNQSAVELNKEGVFTKVLLDVLNGADYNITYNSLENRIKLYMKNVYEQTPKVYISNESTDDRSTLFLDRPYKGNPYIIGEITCNETDGWQLDLGAIHGIKKTDLLRIYSDKNPNTFFSAKIIKIGIDYSQLEPENKLDEKLIYYSCIENNQLNILNIYFSINDAALAQREELVKTLVGKNWLNLVEAESDAQYVLRFLDDKFYLTLPDDKFRPLVSPIKISEDFSENITQYLKHISKWYFLKNLEGSEKKSSDLANDIKIEYLIGMPLEDYKIVSQNQELKIELKEVDGVFKNVMKIKLTNIGNKNLYCCMLYQMQNFGSYSRYLNPAVYLLSPNESVELRYKANPVIEFGLDKMFRLYNWECCIDHFLLIISTINFNASGLDFAPLPSPENLSVNRSLKKGTARSAITDYSEKVFEKIYGENWATKLFTVKTDNPYYNLFDQNDLQPMDENLKCFTDGLYNKFLLTKNNQIMQTKDVAKFVKGLEISESKSAYSSKRGIGDVEDAQKFVEGKEQAFLSDKSIFSFASEVSGQIREDVLNSTLLAQLAANKEFNTEDKLVDWQKKFAEVLNNLGWVVEAAEFQTFDSKEDLLEVEGVIIDILTASFGATIIPIVKKTLEAIKGLANTDGKIKAFESNTTEVTKGVFQMGVATQKNDAVALQLGSFIIDSSTKIKRILFVKIEKNATTLKYNSQKATLSQTQYSNARQAIIDKLGLKTKEFITSIEI